MRVNFTAYSGSRDADPRSTAIRLTIRPARGAPGEFSYSTDSQTFLQMLRQKTELRLTDLQRFKDELQSSRSARLLGVEMSMHALTEIGYFVD